MARREYVMGLGVLLLRVGESGSFAGQSQLDGFDVSMMVVTGLSSARYEVLRIVVGGVSVPIVRAVFQLSSIGVDRREVRFRAMRGKEVEVWFRNVSGGVGRFSVAFLGKVEDPTSFCSKRGGGDV